MSRQDIHVDAIYGEVETTDNLTNKTIYEYRFLDRMPGMDNDNFTYAEILVPSNFENRYSEISGIRVQIPYCPVFKILMIRFKLENGNGVDEFMINRTDNKIWFPVYILHEDEEVPIKLSEFRKYNENDYYNLLMKNGKLELYSADETDFQIKASLQQNEIFLLKAMAGNIYQYPKTGVGLIEFLHGNFENSGLAQKLQSEFEADNMIINNAFMDSATGELLLDVTEKNG
ncbi:hypothetical protein [Bacteroides sp.]|uniref:hypothetical protein n=1 Tax=Bacteroides sp. TaxID=29523 RepID=UPI0025BD12D5|nr:hypothetical protein [Bacteroides sp.]